MCDMDPSGTYDFLLVLHNIIAPNSYTVSETNKDFGRQTQIFFALRVFYRPVENFTFYGARKTFRRTYTAGGAYSAPQFI